jgi:hypothetical protein
VLVVAIGARLAVVLPELSPPADNFQITGRVSPTIVDLVAAGTTGLAGAIAVGRRDIGDILPGVAIAISLVPPLAVVGVTAVDGPWHDALGALLLFLTIRGPHHGDVGTDVVEPDDAVHPTPLVRRLAFQLHTELGEERFGRLEVVDNDENVSIRWIVIGLPVSWGAPVGALHLVSGAGQSFSTSNRSFGSQIVA